MSEQYLSGELKKIKNSIGSLKSNYKEIASWIVDFEKHHKKNSYEEIDKNFIETKNQLQTIIEDSNEKIKKLGLENQKHQSEISLNIENMTNIRHHLENLAASNLDKLKKSAEADIVSLKKDFQKNMSELKSN